MTMSQIDRPEPRWQVILALLAVAGIYMALPKELIVGPDWLLPVLVVVLLVPTVFAHRTGRHSLNHVLGIVICAIITFGLMASVVLLVTTIPGGKEPALALLRSGGALWLTNILVFALWYWRLDGGGPTKRETDDEFGSRSFVFPQMQIQKTERKTFGADGWRPGFVDYLFIAFTTSSTFGPTDVPVLTRWAKLFTMTQILISLTIMVLLISRAVGVL
jgi:ion channel